MRSGVRSVSGAGSGSGTSTTCNMRFQNGVNTV
jgi:hypothetical protein